MKLLDLYCGGGAASFGYEQAGFEVTGIDIVYKKNYRGTFIQADAIEYLKENYESFDVIHASPPCQKWSNSTIQWRKKGVVYPDLIEEVRDVLKEIDKPYVIENIPKSPLRDPIELCGTMFGLRTYRHRWFESNLPLEAPSHPPHAHKNAKMGRMPTEEEFVQYVGHFVGVSIVKEMTGLHWLSRNDLAQSIPPQYTKYIGTQILKWL